MNHLLLPSPDLREAHEDDRRTILAEIRVRLAEAAAFAAADDGWTAHRAGNGTDDWILLTERQGDGRHLQHVALERHVDDLSSISVRLKGPDSADRTPGEESFDVGLIAHRSNGVLPTADGRTGAADALALAAAILSEGEEGAIAPDDADRCRLAALLAQDGRDPERVRVRVRLPSPLAPASTIVEEAFRRPMQSRHDPIGAAAAPEGVRGAVIVHAWRDPGPRAALNARLEPAHLVLPGLDPVARLRTEAEIRRRLGDAA